MSSNIYLIDLDHTLIDSTCLFAKLHQSMNEWLMKFLQCSRTRALAYRTYTWRTYGATFQGLWNEFHLDPRIFFQETHAFIQEEPIPHNPLLENWMQQAIGTKVLYSNSPRLYAYTVLEKLKIKKYFQHIICAEDMKLDGIYSMKPSRKFLDNILQKQAWDPSCTYFFDDTLKNLQEASTLGIQTVWCYGFAHGTKGLNLLKDQPYQPNYSVCNFLDFFHK